MARSTKPENLRQQAERLRAQLAEIEAKAKAHDSQRHAIIGRAVEAHAINDPEFQQALRGALDIAVITRGERDLLGLTPLPKSNRGRPRKVKEPEPIPPGAAADEGI